MLLSARLGRLLTRYSYVTTDVTDHAGPDLGGPRLVSAFEVRRVPCWWRAGVAEPWPPPETSAAAGGEG